MRLHDTLAEPNMVTQSLYEELELSEDYSSVSRGSSGDEQEQGLLGGWKGRDAEEQAEHILSARRRPWTWAAWAAVAAAAVVAVVITTAFTLGLGQTGEHGIEESQGVQTNDYILDPDLSLIHI